jgi:hypothetical protein
MIHALAPLEIPVIGAAESDLGMRAGGSTSAANLNVSVVGIV